MPVYIVKLDACECLPVPDFIFRADNMVSAVMKCQEMLEDIQAKVRGSNVDDHDEATISSIEEMYGTELMDEKGVSDMVDLWKSVHVDV